MPGEDIRVARFEEVPFDDDCFDIVVSKYAIQTAPNLGPIWSEVHRILKPKGVFVYLAVHPMRQFLERKKQGEDYFQQTIVDSLILNNSILVKEPTHTFNEYLTGDFLSKFDIQKYQESWDPAAERIGGQKYPGYFIIKASKR